MFFKKKKPAAAENTAAQFDTNAPEVVTPAKPQFDPGLVAKFNDVAGHLAGREARGRSSYIPYLPSCE